MVLVNKLNKITIYLLTIFTSFLVLGCATTNNLGDLGKRFEEIKKIETLLFNQMPLPKDARISPDKSLILGDGDNWAGRIELSSSMEPLEASAFFSTEYPKHNWQLISSTKAKLSILVFMGSSRTLTLEIIEGGPLAAKSMIVMTVAPKVQNQTTPDPKK
jgi:hypothetical protein